MTYASKILVSCKNKTLCQLCKRLTWPIIPHSWSGLVWKRVSPMDVITMGQSTTIFLCIWPFSAWWRTSNQPGDPSASLLLVSEKAVFCNKWIAPLMCCQAYLSLQWLSTSSIHLCLVLDKSRKLKALIRSLSCLTSEIYAAQENNYIGNIVYDQPLGVARMNLLMP